MQPTQDHLIINCTITCIQELPVGAISEVVFAPRSTPKAQSMAPALVLVLVLILMSLPIPELH